MSELLHSHDQWVLWRHEERDGGITKVPLSPNSTSRADSTDSTTWSSFGKVIEQHESGRGDGIGFVFTRDDHIAGIDLDDCRDPETGEVTPWAQQIIDDFDSYAEVSPSGTGIHIYIVGRKPGDRCRCDIEDGHIEIYDENRFFTVTGDHVKGTPSEVEQRNDRLGELYHSLFDDDSQGDSEGPEEHDTTATDLSDEELIEKAKNAKNGDRFERLWNGDVSGYKSHSEADLALCGQLAFWTGGDRARIERLFARSGLMRDKWDEREDYRKRTINKALSERTEFYEPQESVDGIADEMQARVLDPYYSDDDTSITLKTAKSRAADVFGEYYSFVMPGQMMTGWQHNLHVYDESGIYLPTAEELVRTRCRQLLGGLADKAFVREVIHHIENDHRAFERELQTAPERLVVKNGILDLTTGELDEHTPDEYHRWRLEVAWNPDAECEEIDAFLHSVVDESDVDTLYQFIAHSLFDDYPEAKALMLLGEGSNGKGVFLELVTEFLGAENVSQQSLHSLTRNRFSARNLLGKAANIHADMSDQNVNSMRMFKNLTGKDTVQADVKFEQPVQFINTATMMFACNELPRIKDDTRGNWRRWVLVEFPNSFSRGGPDYVPRHVLEERLHDESELEGLLVRCVEEIKAWNDGRAWFPDASDWKETRAQMRAAAEPVFDFAQVALRPNEEGVIRKSDVRLACEQYCDEHGVAMPDKSQFGRKLHETDIAIDAGQNTIDGTREATYRNVEFSSEGKRLLDQARGGEHATLDSLMNPRRRIHRELERGRLPEVVLRERLDDLDLDRWLTKLRKDGTILTKNEDGVEWVEWN